MVLAQSFQDEGDVARISFKQAALARAEYTVGDLQESKKLIVIAQSLKRKIESWLHLEDREKEDETEYAYDRLVCVYFR